MLYLRLALLFFFFWIVWIAYHVATKEARRVGVCGFVYGGGDIKTRENVELYFSLSIFPQTRGRRNHPKPSSPRRRSRHGRPPPPPPRDLWWVSPPPSARPPPRIAGIRTAPALVHYSAPTRRFLISWWSLVWLPSSKELGRRQASSAAAGDAVAELRGAREDVKQLLKEKSCHPILVSYTRPWIPSFRVQQRNAVLGFRLSSGQPRNSEFNNTSSLCSQGTDTALLCCDECCRCTCLQPVTHASFKIISVFAISARFTVPGFASAWPNISWCSLQMPLCDLSAELLLVSGSLGLAWRWYLWQEH